MKLNFFVGLILALMPLLAMAGGWQMCPPGVKERDEFPPIKIIGPNDQKRHWGCPNWFGQYESSSQTEELYNSRKNTKAEEKFLHNIFSQPRRYAGLFGRVIGYLKKRPDYILNNHQENYDNSQNLLG